MTATALTLTFVEAGVLRPDPKLKTGATAFISGIKNDGVLMGVFEVLPVWGLVCSRATRAPFALPTDEPVTPVAS